MKLQTRLNGVKTIRISRKYIMLIILTIALEKHILFGEMIVK